MSKTDWVTELDVIIGADTLSAEQKAYRLSQKVWINPALETLRIANRKAGIPYIVSIAGREYRFYHAEDAWRFAPVRTRAYCDCLYFRGVIESGQVWTSVDVSVYKDVTKI